MLFGGAVLTGLTLLAACGGDSTKPADTDITGNWSLTATPANSQLNITCNVQTQVRFQQTGTTIGGQFTSGMITCTGPGGTETGAVTGPITGTITGNSLSFSDDGGCSFTGTVSGSYSNKMQGTHTCTFDDG